MSAASAETAKPLSTTHASNHLFMTRPPTNTTLAESRPASRMSLLLYGNGRIGMRGNEYGRKMQRTIHDRLRIRVRKSASAEWNCMDGAQSTGEAQCHVAPAALRHGCCSCAPGS